MKIFIFSWLCYLFCKLWIIHPEVACDYCERIEEMEDSKDTIIVTGIPEKTEKEDFVNYFSSVGEISVSDLRAEKREGIITYTDVTNVPKAVLQFNEKDFKGSYITVLKPEEFFKQCSTKPEVYISNLPKDVKNMAWHLWFLPNVGGIGGKGGKGGSGGCFGSSGQDGEDGVGEMGGKGGKGGDGLFGWFRSKKPEEPAQHSLEGGGQGGKGGSGLFGFFKGQDGQPGEAGPGGKGGKGGKGGSLL